MSLGQRPPLTLGQLLKRLGDIPPARVRLVPTPGTATEEDATRAHDRRKRLCELVDGVLVEKPMGAFESRVAFALGFFLESFLDAHDLGTVLGADGMLRLAPGLVRIPDLTFIAWDQLPGRRFPDVPIPSLHPTLAVEVLSKGNTRREMARKLEEYFLAGTALVWLVRPKARTVRVYTSPDAFALLGEADTLDGGAVLPGFSLSVRQLFARADRSGAAAP